MRLLFAIGQFILDAAFLTIQLVAKQFSHTPRRIGPRDWHADLVGVGAIGFVVVALILSVPQIIRDIIEKTD